MKQNKTLRKILLVICCICAALLVCPNSVSAAKIKNERQAIKLAKKEVPNAEITEIDRDYEDGVLVYEIELVKGSKKYNITYRASNGKKLAYSWEKMYVSPKRSKAMISKSTCRRLAKKKVKSGTILSLTRKIDDGVDIYKVKMKSGSKQYTLEYHARTGSLIEYEWKLKTYSHTGNTGKGYIGVEKAKAIALAKVPGATIVKAEFDTDDGVPIYEIELVKGNYEYDFEIHAKTGEILKQETDWND